MPSNQNYLNLLKELLQRNFNLEELEQLIFDLNIEPHSRGEAETQTGKVRELIAFLVRTNRLSELEEFLAEKRPNINWPHLQFSPYLKPDERPEPTAPPANLTTLLALYSLTAEILVKLLDFASTDTHNTTLALERAHNLIHTLHVVPALDPTLDPTLDRALFRTFQESFELALDYGDVVHFDTQLASELAHSLARGLAIDLGHARTYLYIHPGLANAESQTTIHLDSPTLDLSSGLTTTHLLQHTAPYLHALEQIQQTLDHALNQPHTPIRLTALTTGSVDVSLLDAAKVIEVTRDSIEPWRREHAQALAKLTQLEKEVLIEKGRADILIARATSQKERAEANRIQAEADKLQAEAEKTRNEVYHARIQLALDILKQVAPNLPEIEKLQYVMQLLQPLQTITESPLHLLTASLSTTPPNPNQPGEGGS